MSYNYARISMHPYYQRVLENYILTALDAARVQISEDTYVELEAAFDELRDEMREAAGWTREEN